MKPTKHFLKKYLARTRLAVLASSAIYGVSPIAPPHLFPRDIASQGLVCKIKLRV